MGFRSILIIEDDEATRRLLATLLARGRFRVLEAGDAEAGLELARRHRPQCVLMDIRLPGMDGLAATRALKADAELRQIPVVAMTGLVGDEEERRALAAGCDGFLSKPFDTSGLLEYLERFLSRTEKAQAEPARRRARLLIVDDDPRAAGAFAAQLAAAGYDCLKASGGVAALQAAQSESPDLILLDVLMPDLDGFEVARRLKGNLLTAGIPLILVTALNGVEDKLKGLAAGADEFLGKPVDGAELEVRIKSMLQLRNFREQLAQRLAVERQVAGPELREEREERTGPAWPRVVVAAGEEARRIAQASGCRLLPASGARQAQELAGGADLVLLSVRLPDGDGYEACRAQKLSSAVVPVALVGPAEQVADRIRAIEAGADDILSPAMDARELGVRLQHLLRRRDQLRQLESQYRSALSAATSDGLTGLFNHAYFKRFLGLEVKRSLRQGHPTALAMLDIDDFKSCNDSFGHLAGDLILGEVGLLLRGGIREIDLAARYGGEEFVVVLPYTESAGARVVAERLRSRIAAHRFLPDGGEAARVTVSVGVAICPAQATSPEELIQASDRMLYQAKREGKNRVCLA